MVWLAAAAFLLAAACGEGAPGANTDGPIEPRPEVASTSMDPLPVVTTTADSPASPTAVIETRVVVSTTEEPTKSGYPTDRAGRRLVTAEAGTPVYVCGWIVFPAGSPPDPVADPGVAMKTLLDGAGPAGVDQDNFYDIYDWTIVFDSAEWVSLLGYPNTPSRPDFYPASFGYIEFARFEDRWFQVVSEWCDPLASRYDIPESIPSFTLLWTDSAREAMARSAAGVATADDREVISKGWPVASRGRVAEWRLDASVALDRSSNRVAIEINENACASGRPPDDRDIIVLVDDADDTLLLTVFVQPVTGPARCPGNPWYPITVELHTPVGDRPVLDGRILDSAVTDS